MQKKGIYNYKIYKTLLIVLLFFSTISLLQACGKKADNLSPSEANQFLKKKIK